jgi:hypothetical protein
MLVDAAVGGHPDAPRAERGGFAFGKLGEDFVARSAGDVYPYVERRSLEQRGPFGCGDQRGKLMLDPLREQSGWGAEFASTAPWRAARFAEQLG